jgi:hypothetical protein
MSFYLSAKNKEPAAFRTVENERGSIVQSEVFATLYLAEEWSQVLNK